MKMERMAAGSGQLELQWDIERYTPHLTHTHLDASSGPNELLLGKRQAKGVAPQLWESSVSTILQAKNWSLGVGLIVWFTVSLLTQILKPENFKFSYFFLGII